MPLKKNHQSLKYLLITAFLYVNATVVLAYPQDTTLKSNPIIFTEALFGFSGGRAGGWGLGFEGSYQKKNNLFSVRYVGSAKLNFAGFISPFVPIPDIDLEATAEEFSILYGFRKVVEGNAFSISGGLSRNKYTFYGNDSNNIYERDYYIGFPVEVNYQIFKRKKKRIYIYGILPVGKPTGLGQGFGIKAFGNISRNSYLGLAITSGIGYYKKY